MDETNTSLLTRRKCSQYVKLCPKDEKNASLKKVKRVSSILQKPENERSVDECQLLNEYSELVADLKMRWHRRDEAKRRLEEIEEPITVIEEKCRVLVEAIVKSEHLVVYTGAGISTAACIPDYRGSNGIWTRLQQGKDIGNHDLSLAEPTITHMALAEMYHKKILKYVVSQNCDGLHLRSGLPRTALSELHGNMYIEVCKTCKPIREYWRVFDVTENTARYAHKTMRRCYACGNVLTDTIVHFGERGTLQWPLNWAGACKNADKADTIICLGSSLKVLKKYPLLWQMNKPAKKRPNLFIVNLQWTPKDDCATLKINGKCDDVMQICMKLLGIRTPGYIRENDPIFHHATQLNSIEMHTSNQPNLKAPTLINIINDKQDATGNTDDVVVIKAETSKPFSIDNILKQEQPFNNNHHHHLQQTLMSYYLHLQNPMLNFLNLNLTSLYPYQTSLLYSGLHSIINPLPFLNYEFNNALIHNNNNNNNKKVGCTFCHKHYNSFVCLFYCQSDAIFKTKQYRFSKKEQINKELICVCCDYTSSEEDSESETESKKLKADDEVRAHPAAADAQLVAHDVAALSTAPSVALNGAFTDAAKIKIQPGWFGKGYKKNRKFRKKQPNVKN